MLVDGAKEKVPDAAIEVSTSKAIKDNVLIEFAFLRITGTGDDIKYLTSIPVGIC